MPPGRRVIPSTSRRCVRPLPRPVAPGADRAAVQRADPRRHHRLAARTDADPLLSRARPSRGAARSARAADPPPARRARSAVLWFHRQRPRQADLHRQRAGPRDRDAARNPDHPARDLLRPDRRRVHAHPGSRPEVVDPAQGGRRALAHRIRRQGQAHDPDAAHRGGRLRGVLPEALRHHQALRPGGRRGQPSRRCTPSSRRWPRPAFRRSPSACRIAAG